MGDKGIWHESNSVSGAGKNAILIADSYKSHDGAEVPRAKIHFCIIRSWFVAAAARDNRIQFLAFDQPFIARREGAHRRGAGLNFRLGALCRNRRLGHRYENLWRLGAAEGTAKEVRLRSGNVGRCRQKTIEQNLSVHESPRIHLRRIS